MPNGPFGFYGGSNSVSQTESLPLTDGGLDAVRATLRQMVAIVRRYRKDATTIEWARCVLIEAGIEDVREQRWETICCLQAWVRDNIVYVPDPRDDELLQTPPKTLSMCTGDCDDKSILVAAGLETCGFATEFLGVGGIGDGWGNSPEDIVNDTPPYSHVLAAVQHGRRTGRRPSFLDGWVTLETIVPGASPGYFPPGVCVIMPARV